MNILQLSKHMNDSGVNSHIIQLSRMLSLQGHCFYEGQLTSNRMVEEILKIYRV